MEEQFEDVGALLFEAVLESCDTARLADLFATDDAPGDRLGHDRLKPIADLLGIDGQIGRLAAKLLGDGAFAVRALLLDKSEAVNWALGWHQDRTIAVTERVDTPGFGPWSVKRGQLHVQPPHSVIEGMITLRVHIDRVDRNNAPLRVLAGSHRLGRLTDAGVAKAALTRDELVCLAEIGDVWAYRTPVVHASSATASTRRRVLQIDYAATDLPGGLEWAMRLN